MLSVDQRRNLTQELESKGLRLRSYPPPSEKKIDFFLPPQCPRDIQALDTIEFESEYQQNNIELVKFKLDNKPEDIPAAIAKVPANEKRVISATYILSSIGTGLSSTISIMMRFSAPLGIGGAGIVIGTSLMIGLTVGCGVIALALAYFVREYYTKEAIRKVGLLIEQINHYDNKLCEKAIKVESELNKAFGMLIKMKLELNNLKKIREKQGVTQLSDDEVRLKEKINHYINFLVIDPRHANLALIKNPKKRHDAITRAIARQERIRTQLNEACQQIQSGKTTQHDYIKQNICDIRRCFPSLHLVAPKIKTSIREILFTPGVGLSTLGGFTGAFGLSYSALGIITAFTAVSMAFPPLYPILAIAFIGGLVMGYSMYKIKKLKHERKAHLKNQQKYLAYLTRADKLLTEQYTHQLEDYIQYKKTPNEPSLTLTSAPLNNQSLERKYDEMDSSFSPLFSPKPTHPLGNLSFRDPLQKTPTNEDKLNCSSKKI